MLILSNDDIANLLSLQQIIVAVESAMVAYEKGLASVQQRMHIDQGDNTFLCMPSAEQKYLERNWFPSCQKIKRETYP